MTKKQRKQFCPHIYAEWGELFDCLTDKQKAEVLTGITKFPHYEPVDVPIWNFIKSQLQKDYEIFVEKCEKNGEISRNYWANKNKSNDIQESSEDTERIPNDTEGHPKQITNNELQKRITKTNNDLQEQKLNKEIEKQIEKKLQQMKNIRNPDLMYDKKINEVFELYRKKCPNLCPLVYEERNLERRQQVKDLLILCQYDMGYIEGLFNRANEQITFYDDKISFQSLIKNHEKIYQGLGAKKQEPKETGNSMDKMIEKWEKEAQEREKREEESRVR